MQTVKEKKYIVSRIVLTALMFVGFLAFFSALWYSLVFQDVGFDGLIFTVFAGVGGVQDGLVTGWLLWGLLPAVLITAGLSVFLFVFMYKRGKKKGTDSFYKTRVIAVTLSIVVFICFLANAGGLVHLYRWIGGVVTDTDIYEKEYVSPDDVKITFPEQKRNLIYIFMESMETTFTVEGKGGGINDDCIPNLYNLANDNLNFSHNASFGGGRDITGATWTSAAMISHTAGIPMSFPLSVETKLEGDILPSAKNITEVLEENGYRQALLFGSDKEYGGREMFFAKRGMDEFYDIYTAYEDGIVPQDYWQWWGMEDKHLFEYAKKILGDLSKGDEPFALTMLTADTHHVDGFKCSLCKDEFSQQYSNVLSCADRQMYAFVEWIKAQPFFENTTVIITGDHSTMDYRYVVKNVKDGYTRRIYNCFINSASSGENSKNREFVTMDMFPTTLAALGCEIEGNRLGLGTNLFSGEKTLTEKYGYDNLNAELSKKSEFYNTQFD
ncbi:MAG: LTA synthase family protein [Ruminococcaceae bacterium]|nr:LTA synthase family protein [Oscillospiraceae bacterium]